MGKKSTARMFTKRELIIACVHVDKGYSFVIRENYNHFNHFFYYSKQKKNEFPSHNSKALNLTRPVRAEPERCKKYDSSLKGFMVVKGQLKF